MCCSQGSTEQCDSPRTALPPANVLKLSHTPSTLRRTSQGSEQGGRGDSPSVGELGCMFVFFCFFPIACCIPCTSGDGSGCSKKMLTEDTCTVHSSWLAAVSKSSGQVNSGAN